jgi:hypothetical protein
MLAADALCDHTDHRRFDGQRVEGPFRAKSMPLSKVGPAAVIFSGLRRAMPPRAIGPEVGSKKPWKGTGHAI